MKLSTLGRDWRKSAAGHQAYILFCECWYHQKKDLTFYSTIVYDHKL